MLQPLENINPNKNSSRLLRNTQLQLQSSELNQGHSGVLVVMNARHRTNIRSLVLYEM